MHMMPHLCVENGGEKGSQFVFVVKQHHQHLSKLVLHTQYNVTTKCINMINSHDIVHNCNLNMYTYIVQGERYTLTTCSGGTESIKAITSGRSPSLVSAMMSSSMWLSLSARAVSARELNCAPSFRMEVITAMKLVRVRKSSW